VTTARTEETVTEATQLTFDDAAEPEQPKISLVGVARDIYQDVYRDMGIGNEEGFLSRVAMRQLGWRRAMESRPGQSPAAIAADWLIFEILYGCDFLEDPDDPRDLYADGSWLSVLATIGALTLIEYHELGWAEEAGRDGGEP